MKGHFLRTSSTGGDFTLSRYGEIAQFFNTFAQILQGWNILWLKSHTVGIRGCTNSSTFCTMEGKETKRIIMEIVLREYEQSGHVLDEVIASSVDETLRMIEELLALLGPRNSWHSPDVDVGGFAVATRRPLEKHFGKTGHQPVWGSFALRRSIYC